MVKTSAILGLNARAQLFSYKYNPIRAKKIANSKLITKKVLAKAGTPVPEIYKKFTNPREVVSFDFGTLPDSFALKPSKGLGGDGIIVVKKRAKDPSTRASTELSRTSSGQARNAWITTQRNRITSDDLQLHILDILEGAYSVGNVPDAAFFEEYVGRHKAFRKYAYRGTPDIRIVIFNKVPIMAMLRLPTRESKGRANLHQGAIAVGIDIATGITIRAYWHDRFIRYKPGTKRKLHGIKIPLWTKIMEIAVGCQPATGLGYFGADVVLHPEKGPMILELNYMPGLQIQLANMAGLKKRLEKVEDLVIRDAEHGVKVAKALFVARFADRVKADEGAKTVDIFESVRVKGHNDKEITIKAKVDTGAWRTSIDKTLAQDLHLLDENNVLWYRKFHSAFGREKRPVIAVTFWLKGKKIRTTAGVTDRSKLRSPLIIGRKDLGGFLVNPTNNE